MLWKSLFASRDVTDDAAGTLGSPPSGFNWIASDAFGMYNPGSDTAGGRPNVNDQYHYIDGNFLTSWKVNQVMAGYNDYYGLSQYQGDNMRHPDGHSKILSAPTHDKIIATMYKFNKDKIKDRKKPPFKPKKPFDPKRKID